MPSVFLPLNSKGKKNKKPYNRNFLSVKLDCRDHTPSHHTTLYFIKTQKKETIWTCVYAKKHNLNIVRHIYDDCKSIRNNTLYPTQNVNERFVFRSHFLYHITLRGECNKGIS